MNGMTDVHDPGHFSQQTVLRDGSTVLIRAIRPDDTGKVEASFHRLDPQSIYTRFFSYRKELSADELSRLGDADFVHAVVLVASVGTGADEVLVGGASYSVRAASNGKLTAELGFTIEADYQGRGLGSHLLGLLVEMARSQGIARFEADVLASNAPMLSVFQHCGLPMTRTHDGVVVHVELSLLDPPRDAGATGPKGGA